MSTQTQPVRTPKITPLLLSGRKGNLALSTQFWRLEACARKSLMNVVSLVLVVRTNSGFAHRNCQLELAHYPFRTPAVSSGF